MRLPLRTFLPMVLGALAIACDGGGGPGNGGDDGSGVDDAGSGGGCGVLVHLPDKLLPMVAVGNKVCGVMDTESSSDVFTCFAEDGTQSHTIELGGLHAVVSLAKIAPDKVALVIWTIFGGPEGSHFAVVDLSSDTVSEPVMFDENETIWWDAAGLPGGSTAIIHAPPQSPGDSTKDATLIVVDQDGTVSYRGKVEGVDSMVVKSTIEAIDDDTVALLHGELEANVSFWSMSSAQVVSTFTDERAAAPGSKIVLDENGHLHLIHHAFAGHGDLEHLYDDVLDLSGNLIERRAFNCDMATSCNNGFALLDDGTVVAQCAEVTEDYDLRYILAFLR